MLSEMLVYIHTYKNQSKTGTVLKFSEVDKKGCDEDPGEAINAKPSRV
jgi:hypothetical protein